MDGDYTQPVEIPIPNFVAIRSVAQVLGSRAQCHLLLGQPEAALRDLSLIHDLGGFLDARPAKYPMTLVAAMINVAVTGLSSGIIADGLRLQAWREPQLAAIQKELNEINLLPFVSGAFKLERASVCRTIEITPAAEWTTLFSIGRKDVSLSEKLINPRFLLYRLMPRGWFYQNMAAVAVIEQKWDKIIDETNNLVMSHQADDASREATKTLGRSSPYTLLAARAIPNLTKATQTAARNQTLVNEALIACALERHRLIHQEYPEALDILVPTLIEKLPHDLIGGQPLKYHRTDDGHFALYSVGWNERDDGGIPGLKKDGSVDLEKGDWVWEQSAR
jgi:hypothetical protein